jgi:hypothetical protein
MDLFSTDLGIWLSFGILRGFEPPTPLGTKLEEISVICSETNSYFCEFKDKSSARDRVIL